MPKFSKKQITLFLIILCVSIIFCLRFFSESSRPDVQDLALARIKGQAQAPIHIVEFIDFQCPACARGSQYLKGIMQEYPGQIRLEMKYFPLRMHRHGLISARYAECAARAGKFWPFHDQLLAKQGQWKILINAKPAFDLMAQDVHLNLSKLQSCLKDKEVDNFIYANKSEGKALGVKSTPSYFINGEMVVGGKSLTDKLTKLLGQKTP